MEISKRLPIKVRVTAVFVAVGVVWGSAWIPETSLSQTQPEFVVFRDACFMGALRFALAAVVLAVVTALMRTWRRGDASGQKRWIGRRWFWGSCFAGVTMLGLPYALTAWAAGQVSPGMVALCFGLMPLAIVLGEDEAREGAIPRTALGIGGVAVMVAPGLSFGLQQAAGVSALLAAMSLGAFSMIYLRRLQAEQSGSCVRDAECRRTDFGAGVGRLATSAAIQFAVASVLLAMPAMSSGIEPLALFHLNDAAAIPLAMLAMVVSAGTLPIFFVAAGEASGVAGGDAAVGEHAGGGDRGGVVRSYQAGRGGMDRCGAGGWLHGVRSEYERRRCCGRDFGNFGKCCGRGNPGAERRAGTVTRKITVQTSGTGKASEREGNSG